MSKALPNSHNAEIDIRKLREYCLDGSHCRGGNKARVFRAALAIDGSHADWLRDQILHALPSVEAKAARHDNYGMRYSANIAITRQDRKAVIRTGWIVRDGEAFPRFVSAWVI